jgi:hypothetical protein
MGSYFGNGRSFSRLDKWIRFCRYVIPEVCLSCRAAAGRYRAGKHRPLRDQAGVECGQPVVRKGTEAADRRRPGGESSSLTTLIAGSILVRTRPC